MTTRALTPAERAEVLARFAEPIDLEVERLIAEAEAFRLSSPGRRADDLRAVEEAHERRAR